MEPITYVGIDAHKADLHVARLAPDTTEPVTWTVRNESRTSERLWRRRERVAQVLLHVQGTSCAAIFTFASTEVAQRP